ncbi:MAG: hypothetical protein IJ009_07875 [Clostridia bacterium]|nr:hypothetical protein [Clostridia bacterium]
MVKLIVGVRGTGKTKTLIDMVNEVAAKSKGSVICIEKGNKLNFDITHKARLIDADAYAIADAQALYGFVAGIAASDHDITDLFIDSTLKICAGDVAAYETFVGEIAALSEKIGFNVVMTASMPAEDCGEAVRKYI